MNEDNQEAGTISAEVVYLYPPRKQQPTLTIDTSNPVGQMWGDRGNFFWDGRRHRIFFYAFAKTGLTNSMIGKPLV